MKCLIMLGVVFSLVSFPVFTEETAARAELGRSEKLRVLVDKVMQPEAKWVTEEWMVKAAAEAGFNVFSPRVGHERLDEVRRIAAWCGQYGIFHLPWMRGSLTAPDGPEADGKRVVWEDGAEQALWSPNADAFWDWTTRYIVEYARISLEFPALMGVFLDYENYASGKQGNLYSLSYDDIILTQFSEAAGLELPALARDKRKAWLEEKGLHETFAEFQVNHWRERCRALRQAVDAIAPAFQFCVYPAPGTPFMVQAVYPEWATAQAPLILADASTYGRPSRFLPEQESLAGNKARLLDNMKIPREAGIPFIYTGGIDPLVRGADPEFSGKNAVMISGVTDGYWIFYEGPTYTKEDHAEYWKWFTWANSAIREGRFDAQHQPRENPETWFAEAFNRVKAGSNLTAPPEMETPIELPAMKLRGDNLVVLAAASGKPVEMHLRNTPVGSYKDALHWELRDGAMKTLVSGTIPPGESGTIQFTPQADGLLFLAFCAGGSAYSILDTNAPLGFYAAEGLSLIGGAGRLYFHVPTETGAFTLSIKGQGSETARLKVFDPADTQIATVQTSAKQPSAEATVTPGVAGTYSLEVTKADEGVLEDYTITLDAKLPPTLSPVAEQVFQLLRG
ncbi:MAG TPA: hypothetical protein PLL36_04190 [Candidatus Hydrogenedentes bacterium]|nr:MAG: hypothetical protein BWX80_00657 [Candidatus Hydrogenedentes bacterium ADurb.Bin101]HQN00249.1 hypothetical protein [Candidatus Hydrogenedentota bacterium]